MSPWSETKRPMLPIYLGIAVVVVGMVVGYFLMTGAIGGGTHAAGQDPPTPGVASTSPAAVDVASGRTASPLKVVSWGETSGQLAVVVRNTTTWPISRMRVRITARNASGAILTSTIGTPRDVCCTVLGLPPGRSFGLFAELDPAVARDTASVEVEPVSPSGPPSRKVRGKAGSASVTVGKAALDRYRRDTVVTVGLTARGRGLSGYLAAQALLTDASGRVVQVVSGRFYCFGPGSSRQVRLHLFHAVPSGLRLGRVMAYPIPAGVPAHVPGECG